MKIETEISIEQGVCNKEYGKKLLALIDKALAVAPVSVFNFTNLDDIAQKAKTDKKNLDDNKIQMAVAKNKGEWAMLALSFADYKNSLVKYAK